MTILTLITVLVGLAYFACAPRVFDWFSVAYPAACIYVLPAILGYARLGQDEQTLATETYYVALAVLWGILITAIMFDCYPTRRAYNWNDHIRQDFALAMTVLACLGMGSSVVYSGTVLLSVNKQEVIASFSVMAMVWRVGSVTGFALAFAANRTRLMLVNGLLLCCLWYLGFRSPMALAAMSAIVIWVSRRGRRPIIQNYRLAVTVLALALAVFCYKRVYTFVKAGEWDAVMDRIEAEGFLLDAVINSEAMSRFHIVDTVIAENYTVPFAQHWRDTVVYSFIPTGNSFDPSFGGWISSDLYPNVQFGITSCVWAEMYSSGKWLMLGAFIGLYCSVLWWASRVTGGRTGSFSGIVCAWMPYWAFYIHRNDVYRMLSFLKQYLVLLALCCVMVLFLRTLRIRQWEGIRRPAVDGRLVTRRVAIRESGASPDLA